MTYVKKTPLNLAEVEQLTGLSREVLRKWELRYAFPQPTRNARGHRGYLSADVDKLRLMAQLIHAGMRPGALVTQTTAQLQACLDVCQLSLASDSDEPSLKSHVLDLLAALGENATDQTLSDLLDGLIRSQGLSRFVAFIMPAFSEAVGVAWQTGQLGVHGEHRYSQTMQQKIIRALPGPAHHGTPPKVLMTTPPGELHTLGLLGLQVQLEMAGAQCINLSAQTPVPDVVSAVTQWGISVVTVSVSICLSPAQAGDYLQTLRQALPTTCHLWAGGRGCVALPEDVLNGCEVFSNASDAVLRWKELATALKDQ